MDGIPVHPNQWPPMTEDTIGDAAYRCHNQVVVLKPWGLLRGSNGHVCLTFRALDIMDPATFKNKGFEHLRGRSQIGSHGGIHSLSAIRMHVTLVDPWEYKWITNDSMDEAKAFLAPWASTEGTWLPGLDPRAVGSVLKWTTQSWNGTGHTECLNLTRDAPPRCSLLNTWEGLETSREYERYVLELQNGLHDILDGLRTKLRLFAPKRSYHLSLRRVTQEQQYTGRDVW